jgi:hypothetical protein
MIAKNIPTKSANVVFDRIETNGIDEGQANINTIESFPTEVDDVSSIVEGNTIEKKQHLMKILRASETVDIFFNLMAR